MPDTPAHRDIGFDRPAGVVEGAASRPAEHKRSAESRTMTPSNARVPEASYQSTLPNSRTRVTMRPLSRSSTFCHSERAEAAGEGGTGRQAGVRLARAAALPGTAGGSAFVERRAAAHAGHDAGAQQVLAHPAPAAYVAGAGPWRCPPCASAKAASRGTFQSLRTLPQPLYLAIGQRVHEHVLASADQTTATVLAGGAEDELPGKAPRAARYPGGLRLVHHRQVLHRPFAHRIGGTVGSWRGRNSARFPAVPFRADRLRRHLDASMRPRQERRGNILLNTKGPIGNVASMRPRQERRGNPTPTPTAPANSPRVNEAAPRTARK